MTAVSYFSPRTLRALLEKHGFEVLEVHRPTRRMMLHHLFGRWGRRLLGRPPASTHPVRVPRLYRLVVPANLGDIVGAIARKRP